jgi:hypothetical protein
MWRFIDQTVKSDTGQSKNKHHCDSDAASRQNGRAKVIFFL